jgi:hypothetical protein
MLTIWPGFVIRIIIVSASLIFPFIEQFGGENGKNPNENWQWHPD